METRKYVKIQDGEASQEAWLYHTIMIEYLLEEIEACLNPEAEKEMKEELQRQRTKRHEIAKLLNE